ncbi:MAG: HEAT repeat domain-containing protein [Deltaproteobacteria bacterium]|nr:HEAT repeat domain-containing protein [Deltaproteobacteria bacterium]
MKEAAQQLLGILKIRPGEEKRVLAMFGYLFSAVGAFIVGRISRDTLFLELPNAKATLPYMYLGIAVVVSLSVWMYSRIERLGRREVIIGYSLLFFVVTMIGMRFLLPLNHVFYWVYYVWVELFGTIMIIQSWGFASAIFNAREAKRLFAIIGGGGVLANILIGVGVKSAVHTLGAPNLLYVAAGVIFLAFICERWLSVLARQELDDQRAQQAKKRASNTPIKIAEDTAGVLGSHHLQIIAAIVAMTFFVSTLVDYQFKITVGDAFETSAARASYFGTFYSITGILGAVIQFGFTNRLLERFGVLVSLALLPVMMLSGSVWMLVAPGLLAATWLKGSENTLRYTVNDATMQLLYVPVPASMRARAKSFIDGILKPLAIGFSGVFLLLISRFLPVHDLAIFTGAVLLVWGGLLFRLRSEYVKTLMLTLRKRRLDFTESSLSINDDATIKVLITTLESGTEAEVLHAIELLPNVSKKPQKVKDLVLKIASSGSQQLRLGAIKYLGAHGEFDDLKVIETQLQDGDEQIRAQAVSAYARLGRDRVIRPLEAYLKDASPRVRAAALTGLIQHGGLDGILRSAEELKAMLSGSDPVQRQYAAWVLGEIRVRNFYQPVLELFSDPDPRVRLAAITAAGKMQSPELIPALVYQLEHPRMAPSAAISLSQFDDTVEPVLEKVLQNEDEAMAIRQQIPRIISRRGSKAGLMTLVRYLDTDDLGLRLQVLQAAARLHDRHPDVKFDEARILKVIEEELRIYYSAYVMEHDLGIDGPDMLLDDALSVRSQRCQQRIFRLLALCYQTKTMDLVWMNLMSAAPAARANAVEILDNILENEHKRLVIPMVEVQPDEVRLRIAVEEFKLQHAPVNTWLRELFRGKDAWLCVASLECAGRRRLVELAPDIEALLTSKHPLVRETAVWALSRLLPKNDFKKAAAVLAQDEVSRVRKLTETLL